MSRGTCGLGPGGAGEHWANLSLGEFLTRAGGVEGVVLE